MSDYTEMQCPECGQRLRFPKDIGGMLMACPSCGKKFYSDFKLGGTRKMALPNKAAKAFGLPYEIVQRICRYFSS
jgi:sarcosine oxidase delta subunit